MATHVLAGMESDTASALLSEKRKITGKVSSLLCAASEGQYWLSERGTASECIVFLVLTEPRITGNAGLSVAAYPYTAVIHHPLGPWMI